MDRLKHGGPLPSAAGSGWRRARRVSNGIPRLTSSHGAAWGLYLETCAGSPREPPPLAVLSQVGGADARALPSLGTGHVGAQANIRRRPG